MGKIFKYNEQNYSIARLLREGYFNSNIPFGETIEEWLKKGELNPKEITEARILIKGIIDSRKIIYFSEEALELSLYFLIQTYGGGFDTFNCCPFIDKLPDQKVIILTAESTVARFIEIKYGKAFASWFTSDCKQDKYPEDNIFGDFRWINSGDRTLMEYNNALQYLYCFNFHPGFTEIIDKENPVKITLPRLQYADNEPDKIKVEIINRNWFTTKVNIAPHERREHYSIRWCGKGRTEAVLTEIRKATVKGYTKKAKSVTNNLTNNNLAI